MIVKLIKLYLKEIIIGLVITGLVGSAGYVYHTYTTAKARVVEQEAAIERLKQDVSAYSELLANERKEALRVNGLLTNKYQEDIQVKTVYVERVNEVVKYRQNPAIVRCALPAEWVRIANEAAVYPYPAR